MDTTIDVEKYIINLAKDHHVMSGGPVSTGEGAIAVLKSDKTSLVLYANYENDTETTKSWNTYIVNDDHEREYTVVATSAKNTELAKGDIVNLVGGGTATVYEVMPAQHAFIELVLQYKDEHVFVESPYLTEDQLAELERLTNMHASQLIEDLLAKEYEKQAKIHYGKPGKNLDIVNKNANPFYVEFLDPTLRTKITSVKWTAEMFNADGTKSNLDPVAVLDQTVDGCNIRVPSSFVDGFAKVKISYAWNISGDQITRKVNTIVYMTSWNDPVILTNTLSDYGLLSGYAMMIDPAVVDPDNFGNSHLLTDSQMSSSEAVEVLAAKGLISASANKVNYLQAMGMSNADATALAKKFMTLSEAQAVTAGSLGTAFKETEIKDANNVLVDSYNPLISTADNPKSLQHFESFGYFTGVTRASDDAFRSCTNLRSIFLPITTTDIASNMFVYCISLTTVQTLED